MQAKKMPLVAMRGVIMFPEMMLHFDVARTKSINALETAVEDDKLIFLTAQKDMRTEDPKQEHLYSMGVVSRIKQILKLPGDIIRVLAEGVCRARLIEYEDLEDMRYALVQYIDEPVSLDETKTEAQIRTLLSLFERYARKSNRLSPDITLLSNEVSSAGQLADLIAGNVLVRIEDKQQVLDSVDIDLRVNTLIEVLAREIEIAGLESEIAKNVKKQIDKTQKEYYLREQMKVIQNELNEGETIQSEVDELRKKIRDIPLSEEAAVKVEKEIGRMEKMSASSPESSVIRSYIDWIISLPWGKSTKDNTDLIKAAKILDQEHYGLKDVKERIVEFLAVKQLTQDTKGPILCFVGPPGVGKTSIAKSIAHALNRNFVRTSLGGVRDEAEIRGHRRTYIGAIPGRIIHSMKQAGSMNPVFLFDEIDKMSGDFRGDPASAMLEVLDPEQNNAFRDHYLDIDFDLSKVIFLTTANSKDTIPRPLLDRMEIIDISSYMENEKLMIAKRHLIKKEMLAHGLKSKMLKINDRALLSIINNYTSEAGVRNLEREIAKICRRSAREILEKDVPGVTVTTSNLDKYLGIPKYLKEDKNKKPKVGVCMGLAWTSVGGKTLPVEAVHMSGKGNLVLTGQLGDVMQESAKAALGYLRTHSKELKLDPDFYDNIDIHIHCPSGAVPKDGPSAGVTMATALYSALSGKPVRSDIAMTGEITLTGNVMPIGGLLEKVIAAARIGIKTVVIPKDNKPDLADIPDEVKNKLEFVFAENIMQVLKVAIV